MICLYYKVILPLKTIIKLIFFVSIVLGFISNSYAKEICVTNFGKDPVALIVGHSMQWVSKREGRCLKTNETEALIQNIEVKDVCSFDEKTTTVDLAAYSCFRVKGEAGKCSPEIENWEFAEDCEKRVKRSDLK